MSSMNPKLVKVPKSFVEKMWKCQICTKIITKPLAIPECLHIFCTKCIRGMIIKEGVNKCPICQTELGRAALDRLRVDHAMGNIRKKFITPDELSKDIEEELPQELESGEGNTEELPEPTFPLPSKKKERSLSSLGKSPKLSNQNVGRTKSGGTKAGSSGGQALVIEEPDENIEKRREKSRFLLAGPKVEQKNQSSSSAKSSRGKAPIRVPGKSAEPAEGVTDSRKPIDPRAEMESEPNPSNNSTVEGSGSREVESGASEEARKSKGKGKMTEQMSKLAVRADDELREATVSEQPRRTRRGRPRKTTVYSEEELSDKAEGAVDSASGNCEKRMAPIWLTLIASNNQEGRAPLPQIPTLYLRIKDVNLTISFIKKYIMQKLLLDSEDEVEISLWGQTLLSSMKLHSLIDMWSQIGPTLENVNTTVGASAEDFVMVLCYGRKSLPC